MAKLTVGDRFPAATLQDIDGAKVDFPAVFKNAPATVIFFYRGRWLPWCRTQVTAFVDEWERYLEGKVQILGVSVESPEEGKKFLVRVTRDCQEDRPHIPLDPYPVRLLSDSDATLIRACGTENEGHWAGTIAAPVTYVVDPSGKVKWVYVSDSAADRPSPVALAKAACAVAAGKETPADYPGK